ncbi:hypothetical protein F933_02648 [Acinetobacter beijerinckii CIP 110307]|jgi:hypothetical protein|uniref:Uncharacterized protein n=2 Tax=Acinetobacter beijerinckii TaxID=262668 RepID=N9FDT0_9GAMM|nr:hypothetical protein F934_02754 [Acinetobacter beijerinckii ANC 3835]ENW04621.1 hypothetical protein F933_02648 [Acinetobacter beijerinckii CIP 110307]
MCFELKAHSSFITSKGILLMCSDMSQGWMILGSNVMLPI